MEKSIVVVFSQNLQNLRKQRKLTQEQLAELANMSLGSIAYFETGRRWPNKSTIKKLAKALKIAEIELFRPQEPALPPSEAIQKLTLDQLANFIPASVAIKVLIKALKLET